MCLCQAPFYPLPVLQVEDGCRATLPCTARGTRAAGDVSTWLCVPAGAELGMQDWALPRSLGTRVGMFRYSCQGCAPACHHRHGLKGSHVTSYSRGSCPVPRAQLALPSSPHFPGDQLSRNSFCLESSQVFFLLQSCSNCPKAPGSWISRSTKESTWSTIGKPSSTNNPFLLLISGPCRGLQRPETKPVCGSYGRAVPNPCFLHRKSPPVPWEGPSATSPSLAVCPISSARGSHVFGKGLSPFRTHGLAGLCCIVLFSRGL